MAAYYFRSIAIKVIICTAKGSSKIIGVHFCLLHALKLSHHLDHKIQQKICLVASQVIVAKKKKNCRGGLFILEFEMPRANSFATF